MKSVQDFEIILDVFVLQVYGLNARAQEIHSEPFNLFKLKLVTNFLCMHITQLESYTGQNHTLLLLRISCALRKENELMKTNENKPYQNHYDAPPCKYHALLILMKTLLNTLALASVRVI